MDAGYLCYIQATANAAAGSQRPSEYHREYRWRTHRPGGSHREYRWWTQIIYVIYAAAGSQQPREYHRGYRWWTPFIYAIYRLPPIPQPDRIGLVDITSVDVTGQNFATGPADITVDVTGQNYDTGSVNITFVDVTSQNFDTGPVNITSVDVTGQNLAGSRMYSTGENLSRRPGWEPYQAGRKLKNESTLMAYQPLLV